MQTDQFRTHILNYPLHLTLPVPDQQVACPVTPGPGQLNQTARDPSDIPEPPEIIQTLQLNLDKESSSFPTLPCPFLPTEITRKSQGPAFPSFGLPTDPCFPRWGMVSCIPSRGIVTNKLLLSRASCLSVCYLTVSDEKKSQVQILKHLKSDFTSHSSRRLNMVWFGSPYFFHVGWGLGDIAQSLSRWHF